MKPNELADYLHEFMFNEVDYDEDKHNQAQLMLRQQQDLLDGYHKQSLNDSRAISKLVGEMAEKETEIEALKKQCVLLQEGYNAQAILLGVETGLTPDFFFTENDLMGKR